MSRLRRIWTIALVRRVVQIVLLVAFLGLVVAARMNPDSPDVSPWLKTFFALDPLVLISTLLAAHSVPKLLLWSLVTVGVTILLGRVFCGWICPLGTCHAVASRALLRRKDRKALGRHSPWQSAKYYVLAAFLVAAAFGVHWVNVLDPIVAMTRTTSTALLPATEWAVREGSNAVYENDPGVGSLRLKDATEPAYNYLKEHAFPAYAVQGKQEGFIGGGLILGLFVLTLGLNAWRPRFWCRYICPTGALLGLFSWRPLLRRKVRESCNGCDLCGMSCHGAAASEPGGAWKPSECLACWDCSEACRRDSVTFTPAAPWSKEPKVESVDLTKRGLLTGAVGGVALLAAMRITPESRNRRYNPALVRPPGSRAEPEFLQRCLACGLCMKICPTGGLQPAWTEAGFEGLWTPVLKPQLGYCDFTCNLCGQVCPTEAIVPLSLAEKQATRLGVASFDVTRCVPYAYGRDCMVCQEHCPIPEKAIWCIDVEIVERSGSEEEEGKPVKTRKIKQPRVDPEKCIGCGVCENVCPFKDAPGIRVTSANESRHPEDPAKRPLGNQPFLHLPASADSDDPYAS
jgi:polyferredoxin/formate hydrogenlyase subunit 6/NADH:ubiquinone oxidoreductase subunit I